jgi:SPX domain protein involved in polyphosphate accumulation
MKNNVFRRREQKYILSGQQRQALLELMAQRMVPDKFSRSYVRSVYFDTPDRRIIRRSLEQPVYKEKLRLRSYGDRSEVFLELKKKYKGIVYKRRVSLTLEEAMAYMADPSARLDKGQIGREIDYVKDFYGALEPTVYLYYDRLAWKCPDDPLRITLDWNVGYRLDDLDIASDSPTKPLLEPDKSLLEIKTPTAMPLWLTAFLSEQGIYKTSFSKYGNVHMQQLKQNLLESRGIHHA